MRGSKKLPTTLNGGSLTFTIVTRVLKRTTWMSFNNISIELTPPYSSPRTWGHQGTGTTFSRHYHYRKPTHADLDLDFNSHYIKCYKRSGVSTLLRRAQNIPSTQKRKRDETNQVKVFLRDEVHLAAPTLLNLRKNLGGLRVVLEFAQSSWDFNDVNKRP